MLRCLVVCWLALSGLAAAAAGDNEELKLAPFASLPQRRLMVRPVEQPDQQMTVTLGLMPVDIEVDEADLTAQVNAWMYLSWQNSRLAWSGGSVERTRVMPGDMWTPDILPYNMLPSVADWLLPTPAIVSRTGEVLYVPPVSVRVRCRRLLDGNPDRIVCPIKLGSWTYSSDQLDLKWKDGSVDLTAYEPAGRWNIESSSVSRVDKQYPCCPENYVSIDIELVLVRSN